MSRHEIYFIAPHPLGRHGMHACLIYQGSEALTQLNSCNHPSIMSAHLNSVCSRFELSRNVIFMSSGIQAGTYCSRESAG